LAVGIVKNAEAAVALGSPADRWLAETYRAHREFGSRDRRFFSGVVFSYFRWKGWPLALGVTDTAALCALCALLDADRLHPALVLLAEAARTGTARLEPLGNLSVSEKALRLAGWLGRTDPPRTADLVPSWVPDALHVPAAADPDEHIARCIEAFQVRPPTWFRSRRGHEAQVTAHLKAAGIRTEPHRRIPDAWSVPTDGPALPAGSPALKGRIEVQDLASQIVGLVCAPEAGSRWWDACAGSLGKGLHLADLMGRRGLILATDVRSAVLDNGRRRMRAARVRCIETRAWDGECDPAPGTLFDGVLVDAPCSGLGTWHRNPDARWRTSLATIATSAELQKRLMETAGRKVRPGGALVYSTCTLTRKENPDLVEWFLASHPDFSRQPFPDPLTGRRTDGSLWIWPWDGPCNGMFICRLNRR
jgi:16S rRNA (cytosine967-C5)-methyltransferase